MPAAAGSPEQRYLSEPGLYLPARRGEQAAEALVALGKESHLWPKSQVIFNQ